MGEESNDNNPPHKRQKKKRKNFLKNAKKYAKKGQMGRGTQIPQDLYDYFVQILESIKQGVEDPDERQALVNNVLERTKGEELNIVGNQLGCRLIELLLPYATPEDLERFIEVLSPELRRLCSDNFTSHIIETLLRVSCDRATEYLQILDQLDDEGPKKKRKKTKSKYTDEHITACHEFTLKISKYVLNNLEDFVWDRYANHILRSALKCLSGIVLLPGEKPKQNMFKQAKEGNPSIPPHSTEMKYRVVPDEYKEIVKEFANRLSAWPQFKDLPYKNITSALLQVLLYAVKNTDKNLTKSLIKKLLNESFAPEDWVSTGDDEKKDTMDIDSEELKEEKKVETAPEDWDSVGNDEKKAKIHIKELNEEKKVETSGSLPPVFENESAVRLLEAALFVSKKKTYTQIYARCFIHRLGRLSCMKMLNFTVQRLMDNCHIKEEFEPMFDELATKYDAILACGNTGVLVAIAKACLRIKTKQMQFLQNLEKALNCSEPDNQKHFAVQCLKMAPLRDNDTKKEYFIHIHGSVILQTMLDFQRPAKVVSCLLELPPEELVYILCDTKGSHVADAFCKGQFVGAKARDKLIWKLKGFYQTLALSQHGSRAFEQIFEAASMEQKIKIMSEISDKSNLLNSTNYGRLIAAKLDVATFKTSQKTWENNRGTKKDE
ncbi:nucleolar protein 9 isoform X2 [Maniola jurtina]|uniref:nucleolar protein 9 isoform X2 n=1 Tax=Maniola jurtina TaxID=191418 RepID=UPI001E68C203|nr:nucleolar protein 9 isoform X2 [Maniola jurtina]